MKKTVLTAKNSILHQITLIYFNQASLLPRICILFKIVAYWHHSITLPYWHVNANFISDNLLIYRFRCISKFSSCTNIKIIIRYYDNISTYIYRSYLQFWNENWYLAHTYSQNKNDRQRCKTLIVFIFFINYEIYKTKWQFLFRDKKLLFLKVYKAKRAV